MAGALPELDFAGAFDPIANQANLLKVQALQQTQPGMIAATNAENQQRAALAPLKTAEEGALSPLRIQGAQRENNLGQITYANAAIGGVARRAAAAEPDQAAGIWDEGMRAAADQGVAGAQQYIGHFRPDLAQRVGDIYGTVKPPAAPAGFDPEQTARAVATMAPADRQKSLKNLGMAVSGYDRVRDEDGWNQEIAALRQAGLPVDQVLTPGANWQMNYMSVRPLIDRFRATLPLLQGAVASDTMSAPSAQPKPLYEPNFQYVGIDQNTGKPIYHDPRSNQEAMGANAMGAKPTAGVTTFNFKYQTALQSGMNQQQAMEFANGKRSLSPAQMQDMALSQANRELGNMALAQTLPQDFDADKWVKQKAAENYQLLTNAGGPAGPGMATSAHPAGGTKAGGDGGMSAAERTQSINNARAYIKAHPTLRDKVIARVKAAGLPTEGL